MPTPTPETVALAFARALRSQIGAVKYRRVLATNAQNPDAGWCASHDYCDANMVMHEVMLTFGFDMESDWDMGSDADPIAAMWNAAWAIFRAGRAEVTT